MSTKSFLLLKSCEFIYLEFKTILDTAGYYINYPFASSDLILSLTPMQYVPDCLGQLKKWNPKLIFSKSFVPSQYE